jgi:hypothetical protein
MRSTNKSRLISGLLAVFMSAGLAWAAPVPVKLTINNLRCIQNYELVGKDDDTVYMTVTGVAKGAEAAKRIPESGTIEANIRKPAVTEKEPVTLWEGELNDGEFAFVTVSLYQGKGDDAGKAFAGKVDAAVKGVAERSKKTLTADEAKKLAADTLKAEQTVVTAVKETLSREKGTDHFNGLFNVLIHNDGGKIVKRLDPVGLTFGEHAGDNEKIYTKLKFTRTNVLVPNDENEWLPQQFAPISDDKQTVRVKMLETEYFKKPDGKKGKNVTDYLADLKLAAGGKPVEWKLGGEHQGQEIKDAIHAWCDFAE